MERFKNDTPKLEEETEERRELGAATIDTAALWNDPVIRKASGGVRIAPSFSRFVDVLNLREPSAVK